MPDTEFGQHGRKNPGPSDAGTARASSPGGPRAKTAPDCRPEAVEFYRRMFLIRTAERALLDLFARGSIHGTIHTCLGQESCAAGLAAGIDAGRDLLFGNHRSHGHFLAWCDDLEGLVAEIMGKPDGICSGVGGSQHLYKGNIYTNGVQGGMVPAAVGAALAEKRKGSGALTVSLLGDGTMGQGIVYECLNLASLYGAPVLFVLEDNGIAQSTPRDRAHAGEISRRAEPFGIECRSLPSFDPAEIAREVRGIREQVLTTGRPFFLTLECVRLGPHSKGDDTRPRDEIEKLRERDPLALLAEHIPAEERQRIEAEVRSRVDEAVRRALALPGSDPRSEEAGATVGHVASGYRAAEPAAGRDAAERQVPVGHAEVAAAHGFAPIPDSSPAAQPAAPVTFLESLNRALRETMADDPRVMVLGEDVLDPYGGAFKVTRGLSTLHPDRVLGTPICEASLTGLATGLALRGLRPVAEIMFGDFLLLAADQIVNHLAKLPLMYGGRVEVPAVVRTPMGGGRGYGPTHSQSLEKHLLGVPGLTVIAPSLFHDAGRMLRRAIENGQPALFIEHKLLYPLPLRLGSEAGLWREAVADSGGPAAGFPNVLLYNYDRGEPDATLIAYGGTSRFLPAVLEAARREEVRICAVLPGRLSPAPVEPLLDAARESGRVVVAEEGMAGFSWGSEVAALLHERLSGALKRPVLRVASDPGAIPVCRAREDALLVSAERIRSAVFRVLE